LVTANCDRIGPTSDAIDGVYVTILENEVGGMPGFRLGRSPSRTGRETGDAENQAGDSSFAGQRLPPRDVWPDSTTSNVQLADAITASIDFTMD
jgi:hypothetical protein